jgi:hypothetical protein
MTVPHSGIQYAQPSSWKPGGIFRLAASACVAMPIAAQTTDVIAIIRAIVMLSPRGWGPLPAGSQIKQAGSTSGNPKITPHPGSNQPLTLLAEHYPAPTPFRSHVGFG